MRSPSVRKPKFMGQAARRAQELVRCLAAIRQGGPNAFVQLAGKAGYSSAVDRLSVLEGRMPAISTPPVVPSVEIEIPEMIRLSEKVNIMKGEVTVGLFKQVMERHNITGHIDINLQRILANPSKAGESVTYVSLLNAQEFAKRLSDLTGRKFRVQTEAEWSAAANETANETANEKRLSGDNWTWTETEAEKGSGLFILRRLGSVIRSIMGPESSFLTFAIRLVEDLPGRQAGK